MANEYPLMKLSPKDFPPLLLEIPDKPRTLYIRGSLVPENLSGDHKLLCVVGSRTYSSYGKEVARGLIQALRGYPITIVSGLALGIDGIAHTAALDAGLHTIAVPGSGILDESLYPRSHKALGKRILENGGALLSEYEPEFKGAQWSFTRRNRIMAGMSHATLIIEAKEKSGTLVTARLAMEYNRDVLTVPGSIFSHGSVGPHSLIRDGATPITKGEDILEALGLATEENLIKRNTQSYSIPEQEVLTLLNEPRTRDELIHALGKEISEANILLSMMEINGLIQEIDGKFCTTLPI